MRFGVFGCFTQASIGDLAILVGLITDLRTCCATAKVHVFAFDIQCAQQEVGDLSGVTFSPSCPGAGDSNKGSACGTGHDLRFPAVWLRRSVARTGKLFPFIRDIWLLLHPLFWMKVFKQIKEADLLVIGGGNILMDLYPSWPAYLVVYSALATLAKVPVVLYGVGAGPLSSRRGRLYVKITANLCKLVAVRDNHSASVLRQNHLADRIAVVPDPALSIPPPEISFKRRTHPAFTIGVNVLPFHAPDYWQGGTEEIYVRYVHDVSELLTRVMSLIPARIEFFATNYPADRDTACDIIKILPSSEHVEVIEERLSVRDIVTRCADYDFVIATRLHATILSFVAGTPFVSLAYQPKVKAFCETLGFGEYVFDLYPNCDEVIRTRIKVADEIANAVKNRDILSRRIQSEKNRTEERRALGRALLESSFRKAT